MLKKEEKKRAEPDYLALMMQQQLDRYYSKNATKLVEDVTVMCGDVDPFNEKESMKNVFLPGGCCKYMFRCAGISMEPRLHDGDYVGVNDPMVQFEKFRADVMYLIFTNDGKAMVKYVNDPGMNYDYLQLRTLNPDYSLSDNGRLLKEDVRRIYRVVMTLNWKV